MSLTFEIFKRDTVKMNQHARYVGQR